MIHTQEERGPHGVCAEKENTFCSQRTHSIVQQERGPHGVCAQRDPLTCSPALSTSPPRPPLQFFCPQHFGVYHSTMRPAESEGRGREGEEQGGGWLHGQRVAILNRSPVVGRPLAAMLANDGVWCVVCGVWCLSCSHAMFFCLGESVLLAHDALGFRLWGVGFRLLGLGFRLLC